MQHLCCKRIREAKSCSRAVQRPPSRHTVLCRRCKMQVCRWYCWKFLARTKMTGGSHALIVLPPIRPGGCGEMAFGLPSRACVGVLQLSKCGLDATGWRPSHDNSQLLDDPNSNSARQTCLTAVGARQQEEQRMGMHKQHTPKVMHRPNA